MTTEHVAANMISAHPSKKAGAVLPTDAQVAAQAQEEQIKGRAKREFVKVDSKDERRTKLIEAATKLAIGKKVGTTPVYTITGLALTEKAKSKTWLYFEVKDAAGKEPIGLLSVKADTTIEDVLNEMEALPEFKDGKPTTVFCFKKEYWAKATKAVKPAATSETVAKAKAAADALKDAKKGTSKKELELIAGQVNAAMNRPHQKGAAA